MACANLLAFNIGLPQKDATEVKAYCSKVTPKPYVPKKIKVETPEEAKAREAAGLPPPTAAGEDISNEEEEL
jgi:hypothetical protein